MDEKIKQMLADLAKSLAKDYRRDMAFIVSLAIEDDVGAVIRATSHIQDLLLQLVLRNVERLDLVKPSTYSYARLVFLARLFGEINDALAKALDLLATIRNPLAHDLLHQLDTEAARRFYNALPEGTTKAQLQPLLEGHGSYRICLVRRDSYASA
jgi:hypothetical protein